MGWQKIVELAKEKTVRIFQNLDPNLLPHPNSFFGRTDDGDHTLPIGSGMIESGHRHVLQARLKKAGTAWLPEHADQIAHLRVLRANHQWASLWN
jgi:hypothetical protein